MKYTIEIDGDEIIVDGIEFGILDGSPEGNIDLYIRVFDSEEDIYTDQTKRSKWIDWLNKCMGPEHEAAERIKSVTAKIHGGPGDEQCYRTIRIEHACIASFNESAGASDFNYEATLKKAPRKAKNNQVEVKAG
jgi:hypothetical protein